MCQPTAPEPVRIVASTLLALDRQIQSSAESAPTLQLRYARACEGCRAYDSMLYCMRRTWSASGRMEEAEK